MRSRVSWSRASADELADLLPLLQPCTPVPTSECQKKLLTRLKQNSFQQYWFLQLAGWFAYTIVALIAGPVWYGFRDPFKDTLSVILQSLSGVLLTIPLRQIFRAAWPSAFWVRISLSVFAVSVIAVVWTLIRMSVYRELVGDGLGPDIRQDFGGWFYVSIIVMAGWAAFYYGIRYYQLMEVERTRAQRAMLMAREAKMRELESSAVAREAQLRMLRYQLNPHFLFNTLNAIVALVRFKRVEPAQKMLVKLSDFLRYSLDSDPDQLIPLEKEIASLMLYLDIEKVRFGEKLHLDFQVDDAAAEVNVPSLLLQPLFENSIKYAISAQTEGGTIGFRAWVADGYLNLHVYDDGPGLDADRPDSPSRKGIGLESIRQRLETLFEDNFRLVTGRDAGKGFSVEIALPAAGVADQAPGP